MAFYCPVEVGLMRACLMVSAVGALVLLPVLALGNTTILALRLPTALYVASDSKVVGLNSPYLGAGCKILATRNYVFAGAGLLEETPGPYNIESFAKAAIAKGGGLATVARAFKRLTVSALPHALARIKSAAPSLYAKRLLKRHAVSAIFGTVEKGLVSTAIVDFVPESITKMRVGIRACPGASCAGAGYFFEALGVHAAIDATLDRHPAIWREKGIVPALNSLIMEEALAEPRLVAPPVAIVILRANGQIQWLQKGAC